MLDLLMITHNRLEYLQKSLPTVLANDFDKLTIWDNASNLEVINYLYSIKNLRIDIVLGDKNESLAKITSEVFLKSKAEFVGKVDSDMLIPSDWSKRLLEAHGKYHFGFIGGLHFRPQDLENLNPNIEDFNGIKLWRKHHIGGQFIIRREDFKAYGGQGVMGLSEYQAEMGLINGYLWPPLWVEHMEDARSEHYISTMEYENYKLQTRGVTLAQYQDSIINPSYMKENTL